MKAVLEEVAQSASSVIAYAEARAAFARVRGAAGSADRARRELDALWVEIGRLEVDEALALDAGDIAERHHLRGMDALHLASALRYVAGSMPDPVLFVSWDRDQRTAAEAEGLAVAPTRI